tara:strand:+ start:77 stop:217 length:141 start_codon:yes stop_codon:yes gene_type:complete
MAEIVLKIFIIIMFLAMPEIPYFIKIIGIAIAGAAVILDWYTHKEE